MKISPLLLLLAGLPGFTTHRSFLSPPHPPVPAYRFQVCSVAKAVDKLETQPYDVIAGDSSALAQTNLRAWEKYFWADKTLTARQKNRIGQRADYPRYLRIEAASKGEGNLVPANGANAIAVAMVLAYADHRPLTLSPDMIWLLLIQGFAAHIEADPEGMRAHFVDFEGTKQLRIERNWNKGDPGNPWEEVFPEFSRQIGQNTKDDLAQTGLPRFSTTGPLEKIAFDVSLMRAMDTYFDYEVFLSCGIPEITLEGSPEDWALLEQHAAGLARYDLDWWIRPLQPVLHEFTRASQGQVDTVFWQDMVKKREYSIVCSSQPFLTGWMLQFFPYIKGKPNAWLVMPDSVRRFEEAFAANEGKMAAWKADANAGKWADLENGIVSPQQFGLPSLEVSSLPGSMSIANVLLDDRGTGYDLEFQAGCMAIRQDETTLALRPEFGWRVLDKGLHGQTREGVYADFIRAHSK